MGIKDMLFRVGALIAKNKEENEEIPDDETRDKYLRSLRRQKRIIEEREEKKRLLKEITEDNKQQNTKMVMTDDDQNITKMRYKPEKYSFLQPVKEAKIKLLKSKIKNLKEKKGLKLRTSNKIGLLGKEIGKEKKQKQSGFFGKGNL